MSDKGEAIGSPVAPMGPLGQLHEPDQTTRPNSPKPFSLGNRPALTGIRAIVVFVVVYHANPSIFKGSWVALQPFFVLSGFLITSMLTAERRRSGRISLGKFYARRAVRLLPPLFMTVVLVIVYAAFVYVPDASQRVWGDSAAALFYSDYRQAFQLGPLYSGFLTQCWSLAVEEQFYLIWAALLLLAFKFSKRNIAYILSCAGIVLCAANRTHIVLAASQWTLQVSSRVYYPFDTRADALFLGCLLGLIASGGHLDGWRLRSKQFLSVAALTSAGVLIWILFSVGIDDRSLPLVWMPVSEIASAVIIAYFIVQPYGFGTRAMGTSFLVLLGNMSYTIYLVHFPVFVAVSPSTVGWSPWIIEIVRTGIVVPIVVASWFLVEKPLMQWRRKALESAPAAQLPVSRH